jgi:predicted RNA-binding Zn-ribbon protein involved in translation (DUF1610 family)
VGRVSLNGSPPARFDLYCRRRGLTSIARTTPRDGVRRNPSMAAARFCSECGERITVKRPRTLHFRYFCPHCSKIFRVLRLRLICIPLLCALIGFAIGRHTSVSEPFYFIGTPVDLIANRAASDVINNGDRPTRSANLTTAEQLAGPPSSADTICGARTKSGRPCRRKVKGGGYCWQHRAGQLPKAKNSFPQ